MLDTKLFRRLRRRGLSLRDCARIATIGRDPKRPWQERNPKKYREKMRKYMAERRNAKREATKALASDQRFLTLLQDHFVR
jgi:hypothetical protein